MVKIIDIVEIQFMIITILCKQQGFYATIVVNM